MFSLQAIDVLLFTVVPIPNHTNFLFPISIFFISYILTVPNTSGSLTAHVTSVLRLAAATCVEWRTGLPTIAPNRHRVADWSRLVPDCPVGVRHLVIAPPLQRLCPGEVCDHRSPAGAAAGVQKAAQGKVFSRRSQLDKEWNVLIGIINQ